MTGPQAADLQVPRDAKALVAAILEQSKNVPSDRCVQIHGLATRLAVLLDERDAAQEECGHRAEHELALQTENERLRRALRRIRDEAKRPSLMKRADLAEQADAALTRAKEAPNG